MQVELGGASERLFEPVRRAAAGEEVILTRNGQPVARLVPAEKASPAISREALLEKVKASARCKALPGADAARSQDFLYDDDGLPG